MDITKHPTMQRTGLRSKDYPEQNVNSANVEIPGIE